MEHDLLQNKQDSFSFKQNIYDLLTNVHKCNFTEIQTQNKREEISNILINKFIITTFQPPKMYKIHSISFDKNPMNTTVKYQNKNYYLHKFYEEFYSYTIKYKNQPILICISFNIHPKTFDIIIKDQNKINLEKIILLPCEVAYLFDIDNYIYNLKQTKTISHSKTTLDSDNKEHDNIINDTTNNNNIRNEDSLYVYQNEFNLNDFIGKYIDIKTNSNNGVTDIAISFKEDENGDYVTFNTNQQHQYQSNLLENKWCIFYPNNCKYKTKGIIHNILSTAKHFNINIEKPNEIMYTNNNTLFTCLDDYFNNISPLICSFAIIILDSKTKGKYEEIKRKCLEDIGITTQLLLVDKSTNININYYNSILFQILIKTGCELFRMDFNNELYCNINTTYVSVCGIYYSLQTNQNSILIVLVSSFNIYLNKYRINSILTSNNIESIKQAITYLFEDCINNYLLIRSNHPQQLFIYINNDRIDLSLTFSILLTEIKSLFNDHYNNKIHYSIISPNVNNDTLNGEQHITTFSFNKYKNKVTVFFIYENNTPLTKEQIASLTLKLTYYYWNSCHTIDIPACLKYAEVALKCILHNNLSFTNIKQRLLNEPFYL